MANPSDEFVQPFLGATETEEALEWLRGATRKKPRTLGEDETTADSVQLVEELYAAGAVEVLAVEIDRFDEGQNSGKLVIELSPAAQDREMVLEIAGKIAESQGFDRPLDSRQKYVFVMLD